MRSKAEESPTDLRAARPHRREAALATHMCVRGGCACAVRGCAGAGAWVCGCACAAGCASRCACLFDDHRRLEADRSIVLCARELHYRRNQPHLSVRRGRPHSPTLRRGSAGLPPSPLHSATLHSVGVRCASAAQRAPRRTVRTAPRRSQAAAGLWGSACARVDEWAHHAHVLEHRKVVLDRLESQLQHRWAHRIEHTRRHARTRKRTRTV